MAAEDTCMQCGQTDDHPKHHYAHPGGVDTHHFDCLPHAIIQDLTHVTDRQFRADENRFAVVGRQVIDKADLGEHKAFVLRVRDQANKGKHGDELREWIVKNGPKAQEG
jgi:hypothetical protein